MNVPLLLCRPILPRETNWLEEATRINNAIWGAHLASPVETFRQRATHGFLIGAFAPDDLEGTITTMELPFQEIDRAGEEGAPASTWEGITDAGTCASAQPGADTLCCFACTSRKARVAPRRPLEPGWEGLPGEHGEWARILATLESTAALPPALADASAGLLDAYVLAGLDPVLRFHARNKGPLGGAIHWRNIRNGRPEDVGALGFNILLRYPELTREARALLFTATRYVPDSAGEALILSAARLACSLPDVRWMVPYSRPMAYRRNLANLFARLAGADVPIRMMEEQAFLESAGKML